MTYPYYSFLLRLLRPGGAAAPWKISLQDTRSLETCEFPNLEALQRYLQARLAETEPPCGPAAAENRPAASALENDPLV